MRKKIVSKIICVSLASILCTCSIAPEMGKMGGQYVLAAEDEDAVVKTISQHFIPKVDLSNVIPDGAVMKDGNITLPSQIRDHGKTADITWTSSDRDIISDDGAIAWVDRDTTVTLTANVSLNGYSVSKEFTVPVLSQSGQMESFKENFLVNSHIAAGDKLPASYGSGSVSYTGTELISGDGAVSGEITETVNTEVTANFTLNGLSASRTFKVCILPKGSSKYMCYTRVVDSYEQYDENLAFSMHLAYSGDGENYEALNYNSGVLFATGYYTDDTNNLVTKLLDYPYLFYLKDGGYAVMSQHLDMGNDQKNPNLQYDEDHKGMVAVYTTDDLLHYGRAKFIKLGDNFIKNATCEYDTAAENYVIHWEDVDGRFYKTTMKDILDENSVIETKEGNVLCFSSKETDITDALPRNIIPVNAQASERVTKKLMPLVNTDIRVPGIKALSGADIEKAKVTAVYSDGSTSEKEVEWDYSNVDFSKLGSTYTITGNVLSGNDYGFGSALDWDGKCDLDEEQYIYNKDGNTIKSYDSLTKNWADPNICYWNGHYYFIATNDANGNIGFYLREADTVRGLFEDGVKFYNILDLNKQGVTKDMGAFWAPELHIVNGKLTLFFALNFYARVMQLEGTDPKNPDDWGAMHEVKHDTGKFFHNHAMAIDMTYFEVNGTSYVAWSGRDEKNGWGRGALMYIATCDPEQPWILTSDAILIGGDQYSWESNHGVVNEGGYVVVRDGTVYMTYSGASVDNTYSVGLLKADVEADLLNPDSWTKNNYPILSSFSVEGEFGTGHSSFVKDTNGELLFVYHARGPKWNSARTTGVRRVQFDMDGEPNLTLTDSRDLLEEYRVVTAEVKIADPNEPEVPDNSGNGQLVNPPAGGGGSVQPPKTDNISSKITLKNTSIKSVKKLSGKKAKVTLTKKVKGVKGYQIRYSLKKNMKASKKVTIKKASKLSVTISKLKKGKKYFVQVRTFKTVNGAKVYSKWSKKKSFKS